jgi:hypothetical protein
MLQVVSEAPSPSRRARASARALDPITHTRLRAQPWPAPLDTRPMDAPSNDPRFRATPLLVADAAHRAGDATRYRELRTLAQGGAEARIAYGAARLHERIYSSKKGPGGGGRPRLRGALVSLDGPLEDALAMLDVLLDRYPRTPIVAFTSLPSAELGARCGSPFVPTEILVPARLDAFASAPVRAALLGVVWRGERGVAALDEVRLLRDPCVAEYFEREEFGPWDARGIALRRFAVQFASDGPGLAERFLRTLDTYCEGVPQGELWLARGVKRATMSRQLCDLRELLGNIDHLDRFEKAFERTEAHYHPRDAWGPRPRGPAFRTTGDKSDE